MEQNKFGGIILNPFCSLRCFFCGSKKKSDANEIKEQEIAVYKNLQYLKNQGIKSIEISGCDPLEYEKISELISYIKEEGFEFISLSTNGVKLSNMNTLNKLILSGIDGLGIPIYGSTARIHDSVTRTPGSFGKVVLGIKNLIKKAPKINIQVSCLIVKQNKNDICSIIDFLNKLGIKDNYFSIPCLAQENSDDFYIPLKELGLYLKKAYKYALKINKRVIFREIPFCIFGEFNTQNINNLCQPPNLGKYNQPPKEVRTSVPDLPSYRVKKKLEMCNNCKAFNHCDGFFVNDIDKFGIGKIKKI